MAKPVAPIGPAAPLILASGSRYRAELLARLRIPFVAEPGHVDETPLPGEPPSLLAARLAMAKARALQARFPDRWILGSDQTAQAGGAILHKPGTRERAFAQLRLCSGQPVEFLTAIALAGGASVHAALDVTTVVFRQLADAEIERYLDAEAVLDCAGSFKVEGLGITLFEEIRSSDPTALIGLPLIALRRLLQQVGTSLP